MRGIIKGEAIRFIRSNTNETNYNAIIKKFTTHLLYRGYPRKFILDSLKES